MHEPGEHPHITTMDKTLREIVNTCDPAARIGEIRDAHVIGYNSTSNEVWERNPICRECELSWPCDTAELAALVAAEVSHRVSPVVGWLRLDEADEKPPKAVSHKRLRDTIDFFAKEGEHA